MIFRRALVAIAAFAALAATSCAEGPATFHVEQAKGASALPTTVSVLGIYKDGRLSPESWEQMGTLLSRPLNEPLCEAGFSDKLKAVDADRYQHVEESAMSEGITDDLLDGMAKSADADAVIVFHMFGRVPRKSNPPGQAPAQPPPPPSRGGMRGSRYGGATGMPYGAFTRDEEITLEMAASIFSVREHRTILEISMKYSGKSTDEAIALFTKKLATELPRVSCRGWRL